MPLSLNWTPLPDEEARRIAAEILFKGSDRLLESLSVTGRHSALSFYESVRLVQIRIEKDEMLTGFLLLSYNGERSVLSGSSAPFHRLAKDGYLRLTPETAGHYLHFFCLTVYGEQGPFLIVEPPETSTSDNGEGQNEGDSEEGGSGKAGQPKETTPDYLDLIAPLQLLGEDDQGALLFEGTLFYDRELSRCQFRIPGTGIVEMLDDEKLRGGLPPGAFVPTFTLSSIQEVRIQILRAIRQDPSSASESAPPPAASEILATLVELLLTEALGVSTSGLLERFNAQTPGGSPLDRFALLVKETHPVVAIESRLPFVEDTVAEIVRRRVLNEGELRVLEPSVAVGDDTQLHFTSGIPWRGRLVTIPFHAYRSLVDVERVAHELAAREISCLIGCARAEDLPPSLRQVVDLRLELPVLSPALFESFFHEVMGAALPSGWDANDAAWVNHVHHSDFQHPQGLELTPKEALHYIRDRAEGRLRDVEPTDGLSLSNLHGLGEARSFAEDLITDIHEATCGRLDWEHVDRGVLLAGAPGTGKTTLARAIAKDCGIRFISASASGWQAAGHLGDHIRAIRADFRRARRYAPSILFIDEIDSIGSREDFSGKNAQYSTQVVNALLEQIQGMDPEAPVIVIAATNHAERVDPALRRAGRLDRVIQIRRPNRQALAQIFRFYLAEYAGEDAPERLDTEALGAFAFGLTGADVELIVRGAVRRARRAGRPIQQQDLIDEMTRKPRDPASSPRLTAEEVRRVAVHEAGHALAAYLTDSRGEDISFVSIVPRADGTLGFVARMPSERALTTHTEYLERLEVVLGGRAAEEIVFGADGVTGGAQSDLKVATKSAIQMTTQLGLGPERSLLWSETPSKEQTMEASRVLSDAYRAVLGKLHSDADILTRLADALEDRQELTGEEVRALLDSS